MSDIETLRTVASAALDNLERHRRRINALNVYPVPDGDTGTNLALTARGVLDAITGSSATTRSELAARVERAATRKAKGNSGVILSTILRGVGEVLVTRDRVDGAALAAALRAGTTRAYETVKPPVEGTMLTVIREMAEAAERPEVGSLPLADALRHVVAHGDATVVRTTEMLDKLREAGVVDAGGAGLVELARGVLHGLTGDPLPEAPHVTEELRAEAIHQEESRFRYCTGFVVEGEDLDLEALYAQLAALGDSLLVTGDATLAKVHVHTDEPERALAVGRSAGIVDEDDVEIADMHTQASEREDWLAQLHAAAQAPSARVALVAVAQGPGNRDILRDEGASIVIEGGQTANPSVGQILEAITAVNAEHVIVLPNNPNIRLTAERAGSESTKDVRVVPTRSIPEGVVAAFAFSASLDVDANESAIGDAVSAIRSAEITRATRAAVVDGVAVGRGEYLALLEGRAIAANKDLWVVFDAVVDRFVEAGLSYVHVLLGDEAPDASDVEARIGARGLDSGVNWGGQPHYPLLVWAE